MYSVKIVTEKINLVGGFNLKMRCLQCSGTQIKSRKNYSHGKSSKAKTSKVCGDCGSSNIEIPKPNRRFNRRR